MLRQSYIDLSRSAASVTNATMVAHLFQDDVRRDHSAREQLQEYPVLFQHSIFCCVPRFGV